MAEIHAAKENGELDGTPVNLPTGTPRTAATQAQRKNLLKTGKRSSAIHIGTEAPADPNVNAWIDTDEEAPSGGGVSSWSDLGSKWEVGTVLAETSPVFSEVDGSFNITDPISLTTGNEYTVNWNGTEYTCVCGETDSDGALFHYLGNTGAVGMGVIDFYVITGAASGQPTGRKLIMQMKEDGLYVLGKKVKTE